MLRFQPDSWIEGLLRPLILADPVGYVYYELPAPDLRFALVALLAVVALIWRPMRNGVGTDGWRMVAGLGLMFYLWTFSTGNGRYFAAGLLLAGPVLVLLTARLPIARSTKLGVLAAMLGLQAMLVWQHFTPGQWAWAFWRQGPGLLLSDAPRMPPALMITITNQSYSMLVPQFHPASRWVNLVGQSSLAPGMPDYDRFQRLLALGLPAYLVLPALNVKSNAAPAPDIIGMVDRSLAPYRLVADMDSCRLMVSHMTMRAPVGMDATNAPRLGFWLCRIDVDAGKDAVPPGPPSSPFADVFAQIEERCPRFFPPGGGQTRESEKFVMRDYASTDSRAYVYSSAMLVAFRHTRALNPTVIGTIDEVLRGSYEIPCHKLPGRYVFPWERD
jgi:hypothetical protein